jgi:helix-turn-helix protein
MTKINIAKHEVNITQHEVKALAEKVAKFSEELSEHERAIMSAVFSDDSDVWSHKAHVFDVIDSKLRRNGSRIIVASW